MIKMRRYLSDKIIFGNRGRISFTLVLILMDVLTHVLNDQMILKIRNHLVMSYCCSNFAALSSIPKSFNKEEELIVLLPFSSLKMLCKPVSMGWFVQNECKIKEAMSLANCLCKHILIKHQIYTRMYLSSYCCLEEEKPMWREGSLIIRSERYFVPWWCHSNICAMMTSLPIIILL